MSNLYNEFNEYLTIPVIKINGKNILPGMVTTLVFPMNEHLADFLDSPLKNDKRIGIFYSMDEGAQRDTVLSGESAVFGYGVMANVLRITNQSSDRLIKLSIIGSERIEFLSMAGKVLANVKVLPTENSLAGNSGREQALKELLYDRYNEYIAICKEIPSRNSISLEPVNTGLSLQAMMNHVMGHLEYSAEIIQKYLECIDIEDEYYVCMEYLRFVIDIKEIKKDIAVKVRRSISEKQKNSILHEELNVIKNELGEDSDLSELWNRIHETELSDSVREKLVKEYGRLSKMPPSGAETALLQNYIEYILEFPWMVSEETQTDVSKAREILDRDHYGLLKVKKRILEHLAVTSLSDRPIGTIICLVGPPGTGKTSVAHSIAEALGRKYVRVSLGGVHDEAEIRGHRKTYVGAMPGRIAEAVKNSRVNNPLILLDEIDKLGQDMRGNPADALLEVLDSEQNYAFRDHYMELPLDLSRVMFIATANDSSKIPSALYDRLDIIELGGYSPIEKKHIAEKYLIKKQIDKNNLTEKQLKITEDVIPVIIEDYTRESGVRELERKISAICRGVALDIVEKNRKRITVNTNNLENYLGKPYNHPEREHDDRVGVVHGLAWTSVGGVVLDIEAALMPGKGELILTGKMGEVMKESARIALSLVRSLMPEDIAGKEFFEEKTIHIHIPEGAVPKDGPSAGITLTTALYSIISGKKVRGNFAMTGEVTLTGKVLAIGGLKEKLLAAENAGFDSCIIPSDNRKDYEELDDEIKSRIRIVYASEIGQVLERVVL